MSRIKQPSKGEEIRYFNEVVSFYKHINARPPLHKDFDIREIDPEVLKGYDYVVLQFRLRNLFAEPPGSGSGVPAACMIE